MTDPVQIPTLTVKQVEEFLLANPEFTAALLSLAALSVLSKQTDRPAYLKDCAPIHPQMNGAWRGKGSFGHGFGTQVKHR